MMARLERALAVPTVLAAFVIASGLAGLQPARAQSGDTQALINKIDRLQRELVDLQRVVYQGGGTGGGTSSGASDLNPNQAARIELRMAQFESALQSLTGQVEDFEFAIDRISGRLDGLTQEVRQRLDALERRAAGGAPAGQAASGAVAGAQVAGASAASEPGTLGSISQNDWQAFQQNQGLQAQPSQPVQAAPQSAALNSGDYQLPPGTPQQQYQHAFSLLRQANYEEARLALDAFVQQYPGDPLAGNAQYWLGETHYVQGDYNSAAVTFAEAFQAHPDGPKAPASLLKLGMSLGALGSKEDACGTLSELLRRFPSAQGNILQKAQSERRGLGCS